MAGPHLKVHIWKAAPPTEGPVDLQDGLVVFVRNEEFRGEGVPLLDHVAHRVTRGSLDLQLRRRFSRANGFQGILSQKRNRVDV